MIKEGRRVLDETTRADMPGFVLRNPVDLERVQRAEWSREREGRVRKALLGGLRLPDE